MRPKHCCNVRHPGSSHWRVMHQAMLLRRPPGMVDAFPGFDRIGLGISRSDDRAASAVWNQVASARTMMKVISTVDGSLIPPALHEAVPDVMSGLAYVEAVEDIPHFSMLNSTFSKLLTSHSTTTWPAILRSASSLTKSTRGVGRTEGLLSFKPAKRRRAESCMIFRCQSASKACTGDDTVSVIERPARCTESDLAGPEMVSREISTSLTGTG